MEALDGLPPVKVHCSILAEEAIAAALQDYQKMDLKRIPGILAVADAVEAVEHQAQED